MALIDWKWGYWIGSQFQRRGYATEAVSRVITELRRLHPTHQITAECRVGNEGSWKLLHKLGFRPTGQKGDRPGRELLVIEPR
jgi:RimJ/RimL family protein N-acetyltransferase